MRIPPASYVRIQNAYRRGDHLVVLGDGQRVASELAATAEDLPLANELWCLIGTVHAEAERFEVSVTFLEHATGSPRTWQDAAPDEQLDWYRVLLVDEYLRLGRYDDALARLPHLLEPTRSMETRFAATRAQSAVAAVRGDFETAHFLLNTATGIAIRMRSRFRGALVEGDRAVLLANQGRFHEAIASADSILTSFVRPPIGTYQRWGNTHGAIVALTLCRLTAQAGDALTAQRMLIQGTTAVERAGSSYLRAYLELARGSFYGAEGRFDMAEAALFEAARAFNVLGCLPASAVTTLEQGRLAWRRGLHLSARPLLDRAMVDFRTLGQTPEINEVRRLLIEVDRQTV